MQLLNVCTRESDDTLLVESAYHTRVSNLSYDGTMPLLTIERKHSTYRLYTRIKEYQQATILLF